MKKISMIKKFNLVLKRALDITGSGIGLLILSPIFFITAILITVTMPGPIFFKQERIGQNGKLFYILKFRSMKVDKTAEKNHDVSKDTDRLTTFGKLIRRLKIDELPQLINVLWGNMSLVGPRPTFKEQADLYNKSQKHRLDMRPGMTGLAQVNGNISLSWEERIKYDLYYIENYTLLLDLKILLKTALVVILGESKFKKKISDNERII